MGGVGWKHPQPQPVLDKNSLAAIVIKLENSVLAKEHYKAEHLKVAQMRKRRKRGSVEGKVVARLPLLPSKLFSVC